MYRSPRFSPRAAGLPALALLPLVALGCDSSPTTQPPGPPPGPAAVNAPQRPPQPDPRAAPPQEKDTGNGVLSFLDAALKGREAGQRAAAQNNLKRIGLAMHNYHDTHGTFPAAAITDKQGRPLLSWRVAILPFIEQDNLYRQFKLDEPWDSPHNKKLLAQMPREYALPGKSAPGDTTTFYRVLVSPPQPPGPHAALAETGGTRIVDFTDGTSNTILVAEAAEAVPWTKPDELVFDPRGPLPKLGEHFGGGRNVLFASGEVRFLPRATDEQVLRALITRDGGEVVPRQ